PAAARRPARATTPDPMTPSCTTLAGPKITSSIRIEFATLVCAPMRTFFPRLVDGRRTAFGPIAAGAEGERSLQVGAGPDHAAVADRHAASDRHRRFDRP